LVGLLLEFDQNTQIKSSEKHLYTTNIYYSGSAAKANLRVEIARLHSAAHARPSFQLSTNLEKDLFRYF